MSFMKEKNITNINEQVGRCWKTLTNVNEPSANVWKIITKVNESAANSWKQKHKSQWARNKFSENIKWCKRFWIFFSQISMRQQNASQEKKSSTNMNKGNAKRGVFPRIEIWPSDLDLWPWKSIGFQILLRTKYVPSLVKIHWRMFIHKDVTERRTEGRMEGRTVAWLYPFATSLVRG